MSTSMDCWQEMENKVIEKREEAIALYDKYGSLLTDTQKEVFSDYYLFDLSLSEIAENRGISRAAISDNLHKSFEKLSEYESKLHLIEKDEQLLSLIESVKNNEALDKNEALDIIKENL